MQALELLIIPTLVKDDVLEETVCGISQELGAELDERDMQACHRIKSNRIIMKFNNRNNCLQVLRAKKRLKDNTIHLFCTNNEIIH